jgi:putative transposase
MGPRSFELECGDRAPSPQADPGEGGEDRAEEWAKEGKKIDWQKLVPPRSFQVLARRWMVERTFAWLGPNLRMSKDYESLCATSEAFVYAAMSRLMFRRLSRA